jgi:NitT/TauT family transport system substrate-binding protein
MIAENVYPTSVDISPASLKAGLDTQIALGNLKEQPVYENFVAAGLLKTAIALK